MNGSPTIAELLAERVAAAAAAPVPAEVRAVMQRLVLDITGLCVAARRTDYVRAALESCDASGVCTAIGHERTFDAAGSAFLNGIAAHGEDFDDTFEGGPVHAGAVIVPAVLAAAEREGRDGNAVLAGIAVGVEVMCRLSLVAPMQVHKAGFHPTAVFGALAAAASAAATLDLAPARIVDALGIAGSMASGIIEYLAEGAWTKRLHAGWAAQSGLRAALLARNGFIGPRTVFEGKHGAFFAFARTQDGDYARLLDGFGSEWLGATIAFKPYACGTMIHPYIDCAIRLAGRGIAAEAVDEIVCETAEGVVHRLWEPLAAKQAPQNGVAAKFSMPYGIAAGFVLHDAGFAAYEEAAVHDPRIRTLAARVRYVVDAANPYPNEFTGHVRAKLKNGDVVEERQPHLRGGAHEPLTLAELETKFFANCAYGGWSPEKARTARETVLALFAGPIDLRALRD